MPRVDPGIDRATLTQLASDYRRRWHIALCATRPDGKLTLADPKTPGDDSAPWRTARKLALDEVLRWGEPTVMPGPDKHLLWAIPLTRNAQVLGALVAVLAERRLFPRPGEAAAIDIRGACAALRQLAETNNLTNAALLASLRSRYALEEQRAAAIHQFKVSSGYNLRSMYLLDEPALIAAIRKGDRPAAREILNRLLVAMIHQAGQRIELVKSFFMELVVTLCRAAVESGGAPQELLGTNYASISQLAAIADEESLATWLHQMIERVMDSIHHTRGRGHTVFIATALRYMSRHADTNLSRNHVAKAVHLSGSHFSRLFKAELGQSFTDVFNQMRIERAADLLATTDRDLKLIALDSGFSDQSYFTKIFRRYRGLTPRQYRQQQRAASVPAAGDSAIR